VLIVASGWFAAPIALSARPADACEMACCIQQRSCCCRIRHARVKGQLPDKGPQVSSSSAINSCPNGCANSRFSSNLGHAGTNNTASLKLFPIAQANSYSPRPIFLTDDLRARSSTPRAPPTSSIQS
jgi:hypothetical protein